MGCSSNRIVKNQSTKYFTNNILENTKNDIDKSAPPPNNYNQVNKNSTFHSFISCPSCDEPLGKNFKPSGTDTGCFKCFKCRESQSGNYYKCLKCYGLFCYKCPQLNYEIFAKCPLCGESAGEQFKASGFSIEKFNCFNCGNEQKYLNYYKCIKCNGIFCQKCPFSNHFTKQN